MKRIKNKLGVNSYNFMYLRDELFIMKKYLVVGGAVIFNALLIHLSLAYIIPSVFGYTSSALAVYLILAIIGYILGRIYTLYFSRKLQLGKRGWLIIGILMASLIFVQFVLSFWYVEQQTRQIETVLQQAGELTGFQIELYRTPLSPFLMILSFLVPFVFPFVRAYLNISSIRT